MPKKKKKKKKKKGACTRFHLVQALVPVKLGRQGLALQIALED
jgi:hypothetical protein